MTSAGEIEKRFRNNPICVKRNTKLRNQTRESILVVV